MKCRTSKHNGRNQDIHTKTLVRKIPQYTERNEQMDTTKLFRKTEKTQTVCHIGHWPCYVKCQTTQAEYKTEQDKKAITELIHSMTFVYRKETLMTTATNSSGTLFETIIAEERLILKLMTAVADKKV